MGTSIWLRDKRILKLSNGVGEILFQYILPAAKKSNTLASSPSMKFITTLERDSIGRDIEDYFTTKKDMQKLIEIVTLALQKAYNEGYFEENEEEAAARIAQNYLSFYEYMLDFRQALIEYARTLKLKELELKYKS